MENGYIFNDNICILTTFIKNTPKTMKRNLPITIILVLFLYGCNGLKETKYASLNTSFKDIEKITPVRVGVDYIIDIDNFSVEDSVLILYNMTASPFFKVVDTKTMKHLYSFGEKGNSGNEFISPHLIANGEGFFHILDNSKKMYYKMSGDQIAEKRKMSNFDLVNDSKFIRYPYIGYVVLEKDSVVWKIQNIDNGEITCRKSFHDERSKEKVYLNDICWDTYKGKAVIAGMHKEQLIICELNEKSGTITTEKIFTNEDAAFDGDATYYSDVVCDDFIYLLSMRNIDVNGEGESEIEVYDYNCNPVKKIKLGISARNMALDKANGQLILFSPDDDESLYLIKI